VAPFARRRGGAVQRVQQPPARPERQPERGEVGVAQQPQRLEVDLLGVEGLRIAREPEPSRNARSSGSGIGGSAGGLATRHAGGIISPAASFRHAPARRGATDPVDRGARPSTRGDHARPGVRAGP
jgi:hypothetical protein